MTIDNLIHNLQQIRQDIPGDTLVKFYEVRHDANKSEAQATHDVENVTLNEKTHTVHLW
jgi:hypothetical protein